MSKRDQGASLTSYMDEGYAPEAVVIISACSAGRLKATMRRWRSRGGAVLRSAPDPAAQRALRLHQAAMAQWRSTSAQMHPDRFHELAVHALARAGSIRTAIRCPTSKRHWIPAKKRLRSSPLSKTSPTSISSRRSQLRPGIRPEGFRPENKPRLTRLREAIARLTGFDPATLGKHAQERRLELGIKVGVLVHPTRLA